MDITYGSDTLETGVTVMHRAADYGQTGRKQVTVMEFTEPTDIKASASPEVIDTNLVTTPAQTTSQKGPASSGISLPVIALAAAGLYLVTKGA
jgi:hypothetical protein